MPTIKYIDNSGKTSEVEVSSGNSVMQGAVDNMIDGIVGDCGGAVACATCHCYVDEAWLQCTGEADDMEKDMLVAVVDPKPNSRLSCQINVTEQLDGLIVHLPESQY